MEVGVLEWFKAGDFAGLERAVQDMQRLGIRHLRTGFSWYEQRRNPDWFDYKVAYLNTKGIDTLFCFCFTPTELSEDGTCASPPKDVFEFADFVGDMIFRYDLKIVELWNEHNLNTDWKRQYDQQGIKFSMMISTAAHEAKKRGAKTVLGGMDRLDHPDGINKRPGQLLSAEEWWQCLVDYDTFEHIDVIGFHSLANMSSSHKYDTPPGWISPKQPSWTETIDRLVKPLYDATGRTFPVWATEVGYATMEEDDYIAQGKHIGRALHAPVQRVYIYHLRDLDESVETLREIEMGEKDPYQYHLGILGKPFGTVWENEGLDGVMHSF